MLDDGSQAQTTRARVALDKIMSAGHSLKNWATLVITYSTYVGLKA